MKYLLIILTLVLSLHRVAAQLPRGDSILMNENAVQRPLNLHKHQLRVGVGYDFFVYNGLFNADGDKEKMSDLGIAVSQSVIPFSFQYGILEYLELSADFQYANQAYRDLLYGVASTFDPFVFVSHHTFRKGFSDIDLRLSGRVPFPTRKFDLLLMGGVDLPVAGTSPDQPENEIRTTVLADTVYEITHRYHETWGAGTIVYHVGLGFKYRFERGALNFFGRYDLPSGISESITWSHRLIEQEYFEYRSETYQFQLDNVLEFRVRGQFLLFPWFDIRLDLDYFSASGGWSEVTGKRIGSTERNELVLAPGYEILATPRLWVRQRMTLPLSGRSTLASTSFETRLIYNLFIR